MSFKCLIFVIISASCVSTRAASFVDPNVVLQPNFKGWGTSLAWWADMVGGMDEDVFDYVIDHLFSPSKLNLNIVRYVIGGTSPQNYTCGEYRDGAATESFKDSFDSSYDWSRDPRQRRTLAGAKAKGANVFEAFSNTPPQWLTISGCSKGNPRNPPLHNNLDASNAPQFADYATEVIKYFHDQLNITFTTYSPFNEPYGLHGIGSWAGSIQSQEGCNMNRSTMVSVIKSVHDSILAKNLAFLKVAVSDETQVNTQVQSYDYFTEAGVGNLFGQVNVHGYWDDYELSRKDLLSLKCTKGGHELWMDEMGWGGTPVGNMEQGLNLANRVILDLRSMLPSAWVYWQVVEDVGGWGLIQVPYVNTSLENIVINSGYYAMQQFSQHIKKGYQLILIDDENSIAALGLDDKKLVIVSVNPSTEEVAQELDLSLFDSLGTPALYRTSAAEEHLNLPPPSVSAGKKVSIHLPPQSISTLEFPGIELSSDANLIQNGNFESVTDELVPSFWRILGTNIGVTDENAWRGDFSGTFQLGSGRKPAFEQDFNLSSTNSSLGLCSVYLSAWCSSSLAGTKLGINNKNNGNSLAEVEINRNGAYATYNLFVTANAEETLTVYFANNGTLLNGSAKIDDVLVHSVCA